MATPYRQVRLDSVLSTQDAAREMLAEVPVVVIAQSQDAGRGRTGAEWWNAPRSLAVSMALEIGRDDRRPFSLMAGVAAVRSVPELRLKWPNDLMIADRKCGGILVEVSDGVAVVGMGLNLWWPGVPDGAAGIYPDDPGPDRHAEIGALWAAEFLRIVDQPGWPRDEYRRRCSTLGWEITWEPKGSGKAIDVSVDGGLVVDVDGRLETLYAGRVRHIR